MQKILLIPKNGYSKRKLQKNLSKKHPGRFTFDMDSNTFTIKDREYRTSLIIEEVDGYFLLSTAHNQDSVKQVETISDIVFRDIEKVIDGGCR